MWRPGVLRVGLSPGSRGCRGRLRVGAPGGQARPSGRVRVGASGWAGIGLEQLGAREGELDDGPAGNRLIALLAQPRDQPAGTGDRARVMQLRGEHLDAERAQVECGDHLILAALDVELEEIDVVVPELSAISEETVRPGSSTKSSDL